MKHVLTKTPSGSSFPAPVPSSLNRQQSAPPPTTCALSTAGQGLWGELDSSEQTPAPAQPTRPLWTEGWKAKTVVCRVPKLYVPPQNAVAEPADTVAMALDMPLDRHGRNRVLHSLDMQRHLQDLRASNGKADTPGNGGDLSPPVPTRYWRKVNKPSFDMLGGSSYKVPSVSLDPPTLHLLLRRATAAVCAHTGYEGSSSKALDSLSDVMGGFLQNLCKVLSVSVEQKHLAGSSGFQDALEQSLYQCGIAGTDALHKYWRCSVIGTHQYLDRECEKLSEPLQAHHTVPISKSSGTMGGRSHSKHKGTSADLGLPPSWSMMETDISSKDEEIELDTLKLDVMKVTMPDVGGAPEFPSHEEALMGEDLGSFSLDLFPSRKRSWSTQDAG
ncbi:hypothetical protein EMCRGX_G029631 [Ephydatia muelleri]|eukprot:Em0013g139a